MGEFDKYADYLEEHRPPEKQASEKLETAREAVESPLREAVADVLSKAPEGVTEGIETVGKGVDAVVEGVDTVKQAIDSAHEAYKGFQEAATEAIHETELYKALDSVGRPQEDRGGIDGKPMRVTPHNVNGALQLCTANAIVQCPYGITFCKMDATPSPRIHGVGQKMNNNFLTINDHLPFVNVFPYNLFTLCTNQLNPFVALATAAATAAKMGVYTPTPWPCVSSLPLFTFVPWIPTQFKVLRNGVPVISNMSKIPCYLPSLISVVHCGQGLDDSWLKAMFLGGGGIDGLMNVLNIVDMAGKGMAGIAKAGGRVSNIGKGMSSASNFGQGTLNFMEGNWGDAIGNMGSGFDELGGIAKDVKNKGAENAFNKLKTGTDVLGTLNAAAEGDMSGVLGGMSSTFEDFSGFAEDSGNEGRKKMFDNLKEMTDMAGIMNAASDGDVAGMIQGSLGFTDLDSDMVETYTNLGKDSADTLQFLVKSGQTTNRELANLKVMQAASATMTPEAARNFQDTLIRNENMQAEMEKKLPKPEMPEIEEPAKPYKTVPLDKTETPANKPELQAKPSNPFADVMNLDFSE